MLSKTLLLVGSGEFTPQIQSADSYALSFADPANRELIILPTAGSQKADYKETLSQGIAHFQNLGYNARGVDILNKSDANDKNLIEELGQPAMIYFSRGNSQHLLESVKDTLLEEAIKNLYNLGTVVAGCSAGSMLFGSWLIHDIFGPEKVDPSKPILEKGLEYVKHSVVPHYDKLNSSGKTYYLPAIEKLDGDIRNNILGIDEDTALLITDDKDAMVLGKGSVHFFTNGHEEVYYAGSVLTI